MVSMVTVGCDYGGFSSFGDAGATATDADDRDAVPHGITDRRDRWMWKRCEQKTGESFYKYIAKYKYESNSLNFLWCLLNYFSIHENNSIWRYVSVFSTVVLTTFQKEKAE